MHKAIIATLAINLIAAVAFAQTPEPPPAPQTPVAPAAPAAPPASEAPKAPRAPRPPKPPRAAEWVSRGSYLGVDSRDVTPERMGSLKLKSDQGVEILMVDQDAPAGKAGLKEHDVILSFNGKAVQGVDQLRRMIRDTAPGSKVNLSISRDGQQQNVQVELADRKKIMIAGDHVIHIPKIEIPPMPEIDVPSFAMLQYSRRNGLMVENISQQLGDFFGVKGGRGVLVRNVEKNSPAETAGFKAGDVIIRIGNEPIENMSDWNQILRQQQAGKVPVTVIREKHEQTFTLSLPERRGDRSSRSISGPADLDDISIEIGDLGPQIQKEMELARVEVQKAFNDRKLREDLRNAQRNLNQTLKLNQKELQKQMEKAHKDIEKAMKDLQDQKIEIEIDHDNDFK
jgi:membrane-associated protease RseP (regulator of RpoE activity)